MLFNYHTHTKRCRHANGEDREYVENAIQKGMQTLGFSDHAPYLFKDPHYYSAFRMFTEQLEEYADSIRSLQKEYANDIRILCGFELEYYPALHAEEKKFLSKVQPDYCIMGQHFANNETDPPYVPYMDDPNSFTAYISQILEGLKTGDFLYLAHPDVCFLSYMEFDETAAYISRELCRTANRLHLPMEYNLKGLGRKEVPGALGYPCQAFWRIAAEENCTAVIGTDAHSPESLTGPEWEQAEQYLAELGISVLEDPSKLIKKGCQPAQNGVK